MTTTPLRIGAFGPLTVAAGTSVLRTPDFPAAKPCELLEVLVGHRGHRVSKDRLALLLWGDQPPRNHAAALETYVSVLRRTLRRLPGASGAAVITEPGGYRLGPDGVEVDLDLFDAAVREAAGAAPTAALASLQLALSLVRGEVLEGAPEVPWVTGLRETYRDRHVEALVDAGRLSLVTGDAVGALDLARRATALAPLSEPSYQVLMTAAYALGRQAEALEAFDRCRRLLADELGSDPLDQTVALHLAILRHEAVAELVPGQRTVVRSPSAVLVDTTPPGLLGREQEVDALVAAVRRAQEGRFTVAVVSGSTGMGKTRLVEQALAVAGVRVAANRCSDLESGVPLLALTLALAGVPATGATPLPGVQALLEHGERPPTGGIAQLALLERFVAGLEGVEPVALWLDDVQWADHDSLTALEYLQRRSPHLPVCVVLTCDRSRPAVELVRRLRVDLRLDLRPLTRACVDTLGHEALFAETAGHPLFVDGWLRARRAGLEQPYPADLCERALMQCWDAGPQAYRLLGLAAALDGQSFPAQGLADLADLPLAEVLGDLDRLFDLGLLASSGTDLRFGTPALRTVLLGALSPASLGVTRARARTLGLLGADEAHLPSPQVGPASRTPAA